MLDYLMAIATDRAVDVVREVLGTEVAEAARRFGVPAGILSVRVRDDLHPVTAQVYEDLLGLPATAGVSLHVDNKVHDGYPAAYPAVALAAVRLAERLDAEACLTLGLDRVALRRRRGTVVVHDWFAGWTPEVIAALPPGATTTSDPGRL